MASSCRTNSTVNPLPERTITEVLPDLVLICTARPNFSAYHLALASMSATESAKKAPLTPAKGGGEGPGGSDGAGGTSASRAIANKQLVFLIMVLPSSSSGCCHSTTPTGWCRRGRPRSRDCGSRQWDGIGGDAVARRPGKAKSKAKKTATRH